MKILSLYCGAGGIDEGLRQAGFKTTLAIDREPDCCKTMKLNHPETEVLCGSVADYISSLCGFDIIVGGPPCPEFSRANPHRTFDMCEVNNFWQIVENNKPKFFLMENVQDVKKKLFRSSYLLDAADYGVPQHRLRRFFTNLPLPPPTHAKKEGYNFYGQPLKKWVTIRDALMIESINDGKSKIYTLEHLRQKNPVMFAKHRPNKLDSQCLTVTAKDRTCSDMLTDGVYARKFTNEEFAILQGFPKSYKFFGTKTSVRRQIGNAVPPPVIYAFFKQLHKT